MPEKVSLSFSESAISDLENLQDYYNEQGSPDAGKRIVARLVSKTEKLVSHPSIGRVVPEFGLESIREIIDPPFRIVYVKEKNRVRIVRFWRSERLLNMPGE